jgi:hypothetical protein
MHLKHGIENLFHIVWTGISAPRNVLLGISMCCMDKSGPNRTVFLEQFVKLFVLEVLYLRLC